MDNQLNLPRLANLMGNLSELGSLMRPNNQMPVPIQDDYSYSDPHEESVHQRGNYEEDNQEVLFNLSPNSPSQTESPDVNNLPIIKKKKSLKYVKDFSGQNGSEVESLPSQNNQETFHGLKQVFDGHLNLITTKLEQETQEKLKLQNAINGHLKKISEAEKENARLKKLFEIQNLSSTEKLKNVISENELLKKKVQELQAKSQKYDELKSELSAKEALILEERKNFSVEKNIELSLKCQELSSSLHKKELEILDLKKQTTENEQKLNEFKIKVSALESQLSKLSRDHQKELSDILSNEKVLKNRINDAEHHAKELEEVLRENEDLKEKFKIIEKESSLISMERTEIRELLKARDNHVQKIESDLEDKRREIDKLRQEVLYNNQKIESLKNLNESYLRNLKMHEENSKKTNENFNETINDYKQKIMDRDYNTDQMKQHINDLEETISNDLAKEIEHIKAVNKKLEHDNKVKDEELNDCQLHIAQIEDKYQQMNYETNRLQGDYENILDELKNRVNQLDKQEIHLEVAIKILGYYEHFTNEQIKLNFCLIDKMQANSELKNYCEYKIFRDALDNYKNKYINIAKQLQDISAEDIPEIRDGLTTSLITNNELLAHAYEELFCHFTTKKELLRQIKQKDEILIEYEERVLEAEDLSTAKRVYNSSALGKQISNKSLKAIPQKENMYFSVNKSNNESINQSLKSLGKSVELDQSNNMLKDQGQRIREIEQKIQLILKEKKYYQEILDVLKVIMASKHTINLYSDLLATIQDLVNAEREKIKYQNDLNSKENQLRTSIKQGVFTDSNQGIELRQEIENKREKLTNFDLQLTVLSKKKSSLLEDFAKEISDERRSNELSLQFEKELVRSKIENDEIKQKMEKLKKRNDELVLAIKESIEKKNANKYFDYTSMSNRVKEEVPNGMKETPTKNINDQAINFAKNDIFQEKMVETGYQKGNYFKKSAKIEFQASQTKEEEELLKLMDEDRIALENLIQSKHKLHY